MKVGRTPGQQEMADRIGPAKLGMALLALLALVPLAWVVARIADHYDGGLPEEGTRTEPRSGSELESLQNATKSGRSSSLPGRFLA